MLDLCLSLSLFDRSSLLLLHVAGAVDIDMHLGISRFYRQWSCMHTVSQSDRHLRTEFAVLFADGELEERNTAHRRQRGKRKTTRERSRSREKEKERVNKIIRIMVEYARRYRGVKLLFSRTYLYVSYWRQQKERKKEGQYTFIIARTRRMTDAVGKQ